MTMGIMDAVAQFISIHPKFVFWSIVGYFIFNNGVSTMPAPKSGDTHPNWTDSLGYSWLWNALHGMSGTIGRIFAQYPATQKLTGQVVTPPEPPKP